MDSNSISTMRAVTDIRRENLRQIMMLLARHPNLKRRDICLHTGLTGAGLSRNIKELVDAGLVRDVPEASAKGQTGRRRSVLSLNPDGAYVIGITLSANRKQVCIMDCARNIIAQRDFDDLDVADPERVLKFVVSEVAAIIAESGIDRGRVLGVGVMLGSSSAGRLDENVSVPVLGWHHIPILTILREGLAMPVSQISRSEALLRVEAESATADRRAGESKSPRILMVNCGVGIGSAISPGEGMLEDPHQPQISHLALAGQSAICSCGRAGCLEQVAGGAGVVRTLKRTPDDRLVPFHRLNGDLADALRAAGEGDKRARKAFLEAGRRMAEGLDLAMAMLSPDQIFIAGEVGRQPDYFEGIMDACERLASPLRHIQIEICATRSIYAAGLFALNRFLFSRDLRLGSLQTLSRKAS